MRVALADICDVSSGFTARASLEESSDGVPVLQMRDIADAPKVDSSGLMRSVFEGAVDRYMVGAGDVVFRSKGERSVAAYLDSDFQSPAVAILPVMILRVKAAVLPEYLVWLINQPEAQRHFGGDARSGTIRAVPKASIESLSIDLPDLATQQKIVEIDRLLRKEVELSSKLLLLRQQVVTEKLKLLAKGAPHRGVKERQ
ncbi:restriction endonuclease subunit S [Rhizobium sp. NLR9a]|uniref:restriction endonuclease subunit S n=1 Tax=unclassified Rhizobium TaxID=2613769 RepID=UPI001C82E10E|nr:MULTISPECIES: restriction endonuclease subunit S [unclassified Rhizobium]MBX5216489.1 restriction endonuclease subunit S [Rhizobium sp. NLR9a]MBX5277829.1 restriction endonuclease subunit S [Rhizobium sp. NLR13a]